MKNVITVAWYSVITCLALFAVSECENPFGAAAAFFGILFAGFAGHWFVVNIDGEKIDL